MFRFYRVTGESLEPLYREGDFVLVCKIPSLFGGVQVGDVVVLRHVGYGILIKIVAEILERDEAFMVAGLHPESTDSRQFGAVGRKEILGKVIWHVRRPGGSGPGPGAENVTKL